MKEKIVANLHGTLLIASPAFSQGRFLTLATGIRFANEFNGCTTVDVVALECETTEEIPAFINTLKEDLEKCENQTDNVKNSTRWCEDMIKLLADPVYKKQIPECLKKEVNAHLNPAPKPEQMLYLCGCTYINK